MNAKTLKALKESIAHWHRMATGKAKRDETPSGDNCALCSIYKNADGGSRSCVGCPVMEKTGLCECSKTPFYDARLAFNLCGRESEQFQSAARKELAFLKSLLPKRAVRKAK